MGDFFYQVGGSLTSTAPSYIPRVADQQLYEALRRGEFCYVLNSRQMGKSSLMVQIRDRLNQDGYLCAVLDMTNIGSENITPLQWYKGMVTSVGRSFRPLRRFNFNQWWSEQSDLPLLQRLSFFFSEVLLPELPDQDIVIFIDEIDSILSLPFAVDDFFAFIRACYNQRAVDDRYKRLQFAIFGVANPTDLIRDRTRTPFNIGTSIALQGFSLEEALPLAAGFQLTEGSHVEILRAILAWTDGQPFLTQKLCQFVIRLVRESARGQVAVPRGNEAYWIDTIVQDYVLKDWESQDEPEHLRTIRNRILNDPKISGRLLGLYQQVLRCDSTVDLGEGETDRLDLETQEEQDLILSGLVLRKRGGLRVKNKIYQTIFDRGWVQAQLTQMRPYSGFLESWLHSDGQDASRLLRGQALRDAQSWAQGKRLSDEDYQYLAASMKEDRRQVQQALEAERAQAIAVELEQSKEAQRLTKHLLVAMSVAVVMTLGLGGALYGLYQEARKGERLASLSEMSALLSSARGNFESHRQLDALEDVLAAAQVSERIDNLPHALSHQLQTTLAWMSDRITAVNQIQVGPGLMTFDIHPSGTWMATASEGGVIKFWSVQGQLRHTISQAHHGDINSLKFSPDGQTLLSAGGDQTLKLWDLQGRLLQRLIGHDVEVKQAEFSPNGQYIASISSDRTLLLWSRNGELLRTLPKANVFAWSPDSQTLAIFSGTRHPIQLLNLSGQKIAEIPAFAPTFQLRFSPDGQLIAQASVDKTVRLWHRDGTLVHTLRGHESTVIRDVVFSPDGHYLASVSADKTVRLWQVAAVKHSARPPKPDPPEGRPQREEDNGSLVQVLRGHQATVRAVQFLSNQRGLVSAAEDGTLRVWQPFQRDRQNLSGHRDFISALAVSPDGTQIVSVSPVRQMHLWRRDPLGQFHSFDQVFSHFHPTRDVIFSDRQQMITSARRGEIKVWDQSGQLQYELKEAAHVNGVALSSDGHWLASALDDQTVHLRRLKTIEGQPRFGPDPDIRLMEHQAPVQHVAFSPDGNILIASGADKTIKLWHWKEDQQTFELTQTLTEHQAEVRTLVFHPEGDRFASASVDQTIKLWSTDGKLLHTFEGHSGSVWDVAFNPTGDRLASASLDGTVKLWSLDGELLRTFSQHDSAVRSVVFSPDGRQLISGGDDQLVRVWDYQKMMQQMGVTHLCQWGKNYLKSHPRELKTRCDRDD